MKNLVLITSIIAPPNNPFSYTNTRSVFTSDVRFEQTKNTIECVKEKIPDVEIFVIECSQLTEVQKEYFETQCDYFLNLYNDPCIRNNVYGLSKSLGEYTLIINALEYIKNNKIVFDNFYKLSGRYWLSENFNYSFFENNDIVTCRGFTFFYKLNISNIESFYLFLISNQHLMVQYIGAENLFAMFLQLPKNNNVIHIEKIGVKGYVAVSNDFIDV